MTQSPDERGAEMRDLFFETAQELLQSLNEEGLKLEKSPGDVETVRSIRRIVHTLKGDAAACGFREMSNAAHELEDALALESVSSHAKLAEAAFTAADTFGSMIACYRRKAELPSLQLLRELVRELAGTPKTTKRSRKNPQSAASLVTVWTEYEKLALLDAQGKGRAVYQITAQIDPRCTMPIAGRQLVLNALGSLGAVLGVRPDATATTAKHLELLVASNQPVEQLTAACRIPTVISQVTAAALPYTPPETRQTAVQEPDCKHDVASHPSGAAAVAAGAAEPPANAGPTHAPGENVLRVDAERIDDVLNLVGELIIGKSMLQQAFSELTRHFPKEAMHSRVSDALAFQARVLSDLQRSVMKIRMVPVEQLFRRFPRLVRDVAKQCGKEVELAISGQDTELDKRLLDAIAEPLTHLVRNAISHGIEGPEERTRNGKPATGTLQLKSYHQGNHVIVEVSDNGRGIDSEKVKAKALEKGLLTPAEAARLSEADVVELVFQPGFSTADEVTEISGRGVGLDVVQTVLHRLKASVDIASRVGQGTTFRLRLPLTLAIIKALLFRVEQRLYAIPLNAVAEIARAQEPEVHLVDGSEVLQLRNKVLPLVRLGRAAAERAPEDKGKMFVLVITLGERKFGLIVDALEGEGELVIKALDDQTVATDLVSGASILGDGQVVLILNLPAIVERQIKSHPQETGAVPSGMLLSQTDRARTLRHGAGGQS